MGSPWDWILQALTLLGVFAEGFWMIQMYTRMKEDIRANSAHTKAVEEKLNRVIEEMPFKYTKQEEFIRAMATVDKKLDKVLDRLAER